MGRREEASAPSSLSFALAARLVERCPRGASLRCDRQIGEWEVALQVFQRRNKFIVVQDEHGQTDEVAELLGQFSCKTMNIPADMQRTHAGTSNNRTLAP